ncbi:hypothetical protein CN085_24120 [Sinorhizobium meliloti]|uniref:hypothetical protein n=1 Tax=Rhizobium meliloti TaxID=382 RepID=UPI000FDA7335|nr:hypothetical protein [Sinorhizobium meliloti]RVP11833.1 hypothetical protein CN085_24120 [Sinorhizobium meliloti]
MSLMEWLVGKPQTSQDVALLQGRPVPTGATIKMVQRVVTIEPKEGGSGIQEDRDHFALGQTLIDTLVPHARNPAPFSTHELRYFTNQWLAAMSDDDRKGLFEILMRNEGRRDFNRRNR